MKQVLLALTLIALPVALFFSLLSLQTPQESPQTTVKGLGDLSAFATLVTDTASLAKSGDITGAKNRIKDLEIAWDTTETTLRPTNPAAWGRLDDAIDSALSAIRAPAPDPVAVQAALDALSTQITAPQMASDQPRGVEYVAGIAVSDQTGHPLACETMLSALRDALGKTTLSQGELSDITQLQTKALERCNADDDRNANAFSARALSLLQPR